jgi:hypothetical protein
VEEVVNMPIYTVCGIANSGGAFSTRPTDSVNKVGLF